MIIDLQRRLAEAGRIRIGQQVPIGKGKTRPAKLATFRLTSADRRRIEHAAALFGGQPEPWQAPAGNQWEVITKVDALDVIVPPSDMCFSQHYELWSAGGCQRRCDGRVESISDGPCLCDPEDRTCDIHTRLSVMLRDLPGLGVWRIDTQGYYAAIELQGAVEVIQLAAGRGQMLPARLRLEQRQVKRPDAPPNKFAVPVLDIEVTPGQLMGAAASARELSGAGPVRELTAGGAVDGSTRLTPVPSSLPTGPAPSVPDQVARVAEDKPRPTRRNAAEPVPATGLEPRTARQAAEQAAAPEPSPEPDGGPPSDRPTSASAAQLRRLHTFFTRHTITDREEKLAIARAVMGRPDLLSSTELTSRECGQLINALEELESAAGENVGQALARAVTELGARAVADPGGAAEQAMVEDGEVPPPVPTNADIASTAAPATEPADVSAEPAPEPPGESTGEKQAPTELVKKLQKELRDLGVDSPAEQRYVLQKLVGRALRASADITTQEGARVADILAGVRASDEPVRALDQVLAERGEVG